MGWERAGSKVGVLLGSIRSLLDASPDEIDPNIWSYLPKFS